MADYNKLLQVPRGTKARLETIKLNLLVNTLVYATDTKELGIKLSNGNIEYFKNATDIDARLSGIIDDVDSELTLLDGRVSDVETNKVSISTLNQQLLLKQETKPNGVDSLVLGNKINPVYMDDLFVTDIFVVANQSAMLALDAQRGDFAVRTDTGKTFVLKQSPATTLANWVELQTTSDVVSVNGKTGAVTIEISDLDGLQLALNSKVDVTTYESEQQAQDTLIANKVDKVEGKGLSTNDYTTTEKNKLAGIDAGAEVNVQADWNVTDANSDAFIKNKPTIPTVPAKATTAEAEAGVIDNKYMTPLKTKEAIAVATIDGGEW